MLESIGLAVNSFLTVSLILITTYYAWQTRQTVKEMRSQKILGIRPVLLPKLLLIREKNAKNGEYSCITCNLENIGNGPALHIYAGLYDPETNNQIGISGNFIDYLTKDSKTDDSHIHIKNEKLAKTNYKQNEKGEMISTVKLLLHYDDLYGNIYFSERMFTHKKDEKEFCPYSGTFKLESDLIGKIKQKHSLNTNTQF